MIDSYKVKITLREKGLLATPVRYVFFWLNILVKPKVTVGLEANEVNLMIIQIRLCLLSNTRWQCSYNSIRKKKQNHRWTPMLPKLNNSGYYQGSCILQFRRQKRKENKKKQNKKKQTKGGKGREKERRENWYIIIMLPSRGVIVVAYWQVGPEPLVIKKLANNWAKTHRMNIHPPCKGSHACLSTSFLDIPAVKKQTFPFISLQKKNYA